MTMIVEAQTRHNPYIGVAGCMERGDVDALLETFGAPEGRVLMIGVLASQASIAGRPHRQPGRYPHASQLGMIFRHYERVANIIHYATRDQHSLVAQLVQLAALGGPNLHGFQLNMVWPPVSLIAKVRERFPSVRIILQIGPRALNIIEESPLRLARRLATYEGQIDDALIDPSGGHGDVLDPEQIEGYLSALTSAGLPMGLGIAGGLCAESLGSIRELARRFPATSIDAEARLRNPLSDELDLAAARAYVTAAMELFRV